MNDETKEGDLMGTAIEVKDLTKRYGALVAVNKVSFTIEEGEIFGLLGPNGAGKTTTLEMIEGLRKPDDGSIRVCDIDVAKRAGDIKEIIGVQLQSTSIYDRIKVDEAIDLFGGYYRKALPTAEILQEVSLNEKKDSFVQSLSGGQKQRLALALALVNDPMVNGHFRIRHDAASELPPVWFPSPRAAVLFCGLDLAIIQRPIGIYD
jgi:ABC-2 type transport system ATP-binding protein